MERLNTRLAREDEATRADVLSRLGDVIVPFTEDRIALPEFMSRLAFIASQFEARDKTLSTDARSSTAWHEAGHAVAAHVLDCEVALVTIEGEPEELVMGSMSYFALSGMAAEPHCILTLAGPLAQIVALGPSEFAGVMESHRRQCNKWLLEERPFMTTAVRLGFLNVFEVASQELVYRHWSAIARVQAALLQAGTLTREQFLAAFHAPLPTVEVPAA